MELIIAGGEGREEVKYLVVFEGNSSNTADGIETNWTQNEVVSEHPLLWFEKFKKENDFHGQTICRNHVIKGWYEVPESDCNAGSFSGSGSTMQSYVGTVNRDFIMGNKVFNY